MSETTTQAQEDRTFTLHLSPDQGKALEAMARYLTLEPEEAAEVAVQQAVEPFGAPGDKAQSHSGEVELDQLVGVGDALYTLGTILHDAESSSIGDHLVHRDKQGLALAVRYLGRFLQNQVDLIKEARA